MAVTAVAFDNILGSKEVGRTAVESKNLVQALKKLLHLLFVVWKFVINVLSPLVI